MLVPIALSAALFVSAVNPAPTDAGENAVSEDAAILLETEQFSQLTTLAAARAAAGFAGATSSSFLTTNQDPEGDMPRDVAFTMDGTTALIVHRDTDNLVFFDVATRTVVDTVAVGDFPVDVAVTPDNQYAVVPNALSNSVSVIDIATRTVAATIPVTGSEPYRVAITTDSQTAVVGVINDAVTSGVSIIDLGTLSETSSFATVSQGVFGFFFTPEPGISGNLFTHFALSSNDTTLVLPDKYNSQVALYDITNGSLLAMLATAAHPTALDISSDGQLAVVEHESGTGAISVIDLVGNTLVNAWVTPNSMFSQAIRMTPDKAYAIAGIQNAVQFVELATGNVSSIVSTGTVGDIELSFDGQYAFVSNFTSRVIDIATQSQVAGLSFAPAYDAAASPTEHRMVALNNRFAENVHVYSTNGGASFFEGAALSGAIDEGDAPRTVAIDGSVAVVAHNTSMSAAIVDLNTETVRAYVPTGPRSLGVAVAPDGNTAIVVNAGNDTASIIDLGTDTTVATLPVPSVPSEVVISPDSQTAYVASLAGTDRVHFIDLQGAASSVTGSLVTGQMGSIGYTYGVFSGMSLSADGSLLALCISFDDEIMLVDTATKLEIARIPVGDFPIRATFSDDGSRLYVTHSFGDSLVAIDVNGALSSVAGTVPGIEFPLNVEVSPSGDYSYVGSWNSPPNLVVVDNNTLTIATTVPLTSSPRAMALSGSQLYIALTDGDLAEIDAAGPATTQVGSVALVGSPSDLAYSAALGAVVTPQPGLADGIDIIRFGGLGTSYCGPAVANSSGMPAVISATGSSVVADNTLSLTAIQLPPNRFGYFLASEVQAFSANPGGSQGNLCLGQPLGRFAALIQSSGPGGVLSIAVDLTDIPLLGPVLAGDTFNFQCWYRDVNPTSTSNFSDGLAIPFQ